MSPYSLVLPSRRIAAIQEGADSFSPSDLSGLRFWVTAKTGITESSNAISNWADQSGNGFDVAQSTASLKPTYVADDLGSGRHAVLFDGGDLLINSLSGTGSDWVVQQSNPMYVWIVFKVVDTTQDGHEICAFTTDTTDFSKAMRFGAVEAAGPFGASYKDFFFGEDDGGAGSWGTHRCDVGGYDTDLHTIECRYDGVTDPTDHGAWIFNYDDSSQTIVSAGGLGTTNDLAIGQAPASPTIAFDGKIYEIIVAQSYDSQVYDYLQSEWFT